MKCTSMPCPTETRRPGIVEELTLTLVAVSVGHGLRFHLR